MTILRTITLSLDQARYLILDDIPPPKDMSVGEPAWIGFETPGAGHDSPLRYLVDEPALLVQMADVEHAEGHGPTIEIARQIVKFAHALMDAPASYALFVHCRAGMYRSGAVVQWLRQDYGIPESSASNRMKILGDTRNRRLLDLLRQVDDRRRS